MHTQQGYIMIDDAKEGEMPANRSDVIAEGKAWARLDEYRCSKIPER